MSRREVREDQHGTATGYRYGCRCDECRRAAVVHVRRWREANPGRREGSTPRSRRYGAVWRATNREYVLQREARRLLEYQTTSLKTATTSGPWQPHEDALLARIPSNLAAASALGRTHGSVVGRRHRLRARGEVA